MAIVNPYLKKKPTNGTSVGANTSAGPTNGAMTTKTPAMDDAPSKPTKPFVTTTPAKATQPGNVQNRMNVVTPQAAAVSKTGAPSTMSSTIITPPMRPLSTQPTSLQQQPQPSTVAVAKHPPNIRPSTSTPDKHLLRGMGGTACLVRRDQVAVAPTVRAAAPKKLTLKQRLKQDINALRKQKQLIQMQKEAQERRQRAELERAAKEEERQRLIQARQAEHQARLEEKMRRRQEKQDAMERKRLERLAQQQAAAAKQEQAQRDYEEAVSQYHRDLKEYQGRHAQWLNERRQWMQACQQQCMLPRYSQSIPGPTMYGYPLLAPVFPLIGTPGLIRDGMQPSPPHTSKQGGDATSQSNVPVAPSAPVSTFPVLSNVGIQPIQAHGVQEGADNASKAHVLPTLNHNALVTSDGIRHTPAYTTNQSSESDSQSLLPATQSAPSHSIGSSLHFNDAVQSIPAIATNQRSDAQFLLPTNQMVPTPTAVPSFPQIHPGWVSPYYTSGMAFHTTTPYTTISNASSPSFMHFMARDQGSLLSPLQSFLTPQMAQPSFYSGSSHNVSQAVANMTHMMSVMPYHLKTPPTPPIPPKKPKCCIAKKKPEVVEQPLGAVMEAPSPYAATHMLLHVTLIRSLDQPSYGVNLKALTTTVLVDAPEREPKQPLQQDKVEQDPHASTPDARQGLQGAATNFDDTNNNGLMQCESSNHDLNEDTNMVREVNDDLNPSEDKSITTEEPDVSACLNRDDTGTMVATAASSENGSLPIEENGKLTLNPNLQGIVSNDSSSSMEALTQDKTSFQVQAEPSATSTTFNAAASEVKTAFPRKPRRRRINFTVMTVVDAAKQNSRWQEQRRQVNQSVDVNKELGTLLEPGDIVVSIGGKDVAGCSFVDACAIFAETSVQTTTTLPNGESQTEIQAKLVIARKKQVPTTAKNEKAASVKSESNSNSDSQTLGTSTKLDDALSRPLLNASALSSPANASLSFSIAEIAVLADGVIQAIHDQPTSRLLGQEFSANVLANKTTIFRRVASLKDCILSHRSPETLFAKWSQLCQSMSTSLAEQGRAAWNRQALVLEKSSELSSLSYSSDAERTSLRQLPRPTKGCRCQREDHEYLHDVRCTLYKDICRLLPPEELHELQFDPNRIPKSKANSAPKDLNAVETAFKDRFVKLKTAAEMEEAEARFVARMEEVQVKQLRKAIFAPNLTSMVLSSIMDLQREFPDVAGPSLEREDDESDDERFDDEMLLSGKRRTSGSNKESKKTKVNQVKSINFKYLTRIVQHIGKTWGHVYREPSHEDYAWRWEVFHGHNTEGTPWDSQSTNPRNPNSLSFEYLGNGLETLDKESARSLAWASDAIADLENALQTDLLKQMTPPEADIDSISIANCKDNSSKVDSMDVDQAMPLTSSDPTALEAKDTLKSEARLELSDKVVEQLCLAAYLLSPSSSGFYDEILALVQMGVIDISKRGIPFLPEDWASKVDFVVLEDMDAAWGSDSDPEGRYCINLDFRDSLEHEWVKTNRGWALSSDPDDIVYAFDVMEEWREFFQGQVEEKANISEGIGRFGL